MPKGPKGERRPVDVVGAAVKVMKIATGEIEEDFDAGDRQEQSRYGVWPKGRKGAGWKDVS